MISNETQAEIVKLFEAEQEAMQKMTGKIGWRYHDLPRLTHEMFDRFVALVGKDNLHWITFASYPKGGVQGKNPDYPATKRGQVMISPAGLERLSQHLRSSPKACSEDTSHDH